MPSIDRRSALLTTAAISLSAAFGSGARAITPVAPPKREGAQPLFYRLKVGDVEVTALLDGGMQMPNSNIPRFFPDSTAEEIAPLRDRAFAIESGLHQPVGAFLINTGRNLAMVDCGGHESVMPNTGHALAALRASGYTPEQVDTVILTHIHPEHALGLSYDGKTKNFPNAEVVLTAIDHRFWTDPAMEASVPQGQRFIEAARRAIGPYKDRIRTVEMRDGLEVIDGVFMAPAPGHTPGHVSYRITSQNESLLIWGDIAHQVAIQLARPRWRVGVDVDSAMGVESRVRTLTMLADERILMTGVHVPWPGFGRIIRSGEGFIFVPRPLQFG